MRRARRNQPGIFINNSNNHIWRVQFKSHGRNNVARIACRRQCEMNMRKVVEKVKMRKIESAQDTHIQYTHTHSSTRGSSIAELKLLEKIEQLRWQWQFCTYRMVMKRNNEIYSWCSSLFCMRVLPIIVCVCVCALAYRSELSLCAANRSH